MRGKRTLGAEVVLRLHQSAPEVLLPDAIDDDARGERVVGGYEPVGKVETGERHQLELDMWQVLGRIACPTLIIRGTRSDMFAAITVPRVLAANPRFTLVEIDGGHNVAGDNPDGFHRAARGFLDEGSADNA